MKCKNLKIPKISNIESEMITALRSHTIRGIKTNFHTYYKDNMNCNLCETNIDNQEHCMNCPKLLHKIKFNKEHIKYNHIYGSLEEQREVARLFLDLLKCREEFLQEKEQDQDTDQGLTMDPVRSSTIGK